MAITTEDESLRTEAIDLLVDYAIQDLAYSLRDYYNEHLLKFSPQHFSTKSKETIKSLLNNKEYLSRDLILLIGHLNLIESTNDLEQLLNPIEIFRNRGPRYFKTIDFSARFCC